jgi:hypothetical protein
MKRIILLLLLLAASAALAVLLLPLDGTETRQPTASAARAATESAPLLADVNQPSTVPPRSVAGDGPKTSAPRPEMAAAMPSSTDAPNLPAPHADSADSSRANRGGNQTPAVSPDLVGDSSTQPASVGPGTGSAPTAAGAIQRSTTAGGNTSANNPTVQDNYSIPAQIAYEIEAGMRAPVALLPEDRPMSPQVAAALEGIRQDFDREISAAPDPTAVWEDARKRADEQYRMFFGFDSFNQKAMQDAINALESKK